MLTTVIDIISWILLGAGSTLILIGGIGIIRMPDVYCRMHASSITDTLGAILIIAGLALQNGWDLNLVKLLLIIMFLLLTTPVSTHALAKAARHDPAIREGTGQ